MIDAIVGVLAILGALLMVLAGVGVLRFPDIYGRMHAATKATTVAVLVIAIAGALAIDGGAAKILLAVAVIFVTAPSSAHFVGRAAYRAEGIEIRLDGQDDLRELVEESPEVEATEPRLDDPAGRRDR